jgi:hypothetical protein
MKHIKLCKPQKSQCKKNNVAKLKSQATSDESSKTSSYSIDGWACVPKGNFAF